MCCTMYDCVARRIVTCFIEGVVRLINVDSDTENSLSQQPSAVQLPYHANVKLRSCRLSCSAGTDMHCAVPGSVCVCACL